MKSLLKTLSLVVCFFMTASLSALAGGGSTTYYTKVKATATPTGAGTVYASKSNTAPADDAYAASAEATNNGNDKSQTYYLFAKPAQGQKLEGWYTDENCTAAASATKGDGYYTYKVTASDNATKENAATVFNVFAKFVEATEFFHSTFTVACVGEGGSVAVSTENGNEDFGAEKTANTTGTVEPEHTYYLQAKSLDAEVYRFVAWYTDETCETQLSKNATYIYKVTAESTDEAAPTQFKAYAKFEKIPYFFSSFNVTAVGDGGVFVTADSKATADYQATSSANNKVADKTTHPYYLKANPSDKSLFDGWYADESCTELLSNSMNYTYNVADCSADAETPTTVSAYAKFVALDLYQFANAGFEKWETVTYTTNNNTKTCEEPLNWSSFLDASGSMKGAGANVQIVKSDDVREGATGYSAKVYANSVLGVVAQGNLTNGCINMGSATATQASSNYNYINEARADQAMRFEGRPDAVKVWLKYKGHDDTYNKGNVNIILTTKGYYQDPYANATKITATKVAVAACPEVVSNDEWTLYTIPFTYDSDAIPYYALATFSTSATAGKGNKADYLFVDDIEMVYNTAELKSAAFDEEEISFVEGKATVDAPYDAEKLTLVSNAAGAIIEKAYDEATAVLTIKIKGGDFAITPENYYEYTIQFAAAGQKGTFTEDLYVTVNGETSAPQETTVEVDLHADNTFDFMLKNFMLDMGEGSMAGVGNINVADLTLNPDLSFAFNGNIVIEAGDAEGVEFWLGPTLGEIPLQMKGQFLGTDRVLVNIDIDMTATLEQIISVHLGYDAVQFGVNGTAKYATFCAPFDVEVPAGVTASTATVEGNAIVLAAVANGVIPANTPVILQADDDVAATVFGVAAPVESPVAGNLTGVYAETAAPAGSYVLQNQNGRVGFYLVDDVRPSVLANHCYLTLNGDSDSNARALFFGGDLATDINAAAFDASSAADARALFDLQGRRVSTNQQKGVYVVNGKKVIK